LVDLKITSGFSLTLLAKVSAVVLCLTLKTLGAFTCTLNLKSCRNKGSSLRGSLLSGGQKGRTGRQGTIGGYFDFVGFVSGGFEVTVFEAGTANVEVETADIGLTEAAMEENVTAVEEVDVGTEGGADAAVVVGVAAEAAIVGVVATEASVDSFAGTARSECEPEFLLSFA
jgi:hypothetical protein